MIAVGGEACRTCERCELFVDRHAHSEVGFGFARKVRRDAVLLSDPTDEQLFLQLTRIPPERPIVIISSLQGRYSLSTVPKIMTFLQRERREVLLRIKAIPEEIRSYIGAASIEVLADDRVSAPTVFVSYAWEDDAHRDWVASLSEKLRGDGINVRLDRWELGPGHDLLQFMEQAIRESDFVLVVCTPKYKQKSDSRTGGVGYEGTIMTGEVFTRTTAGKFVPALARGEWAEAAPSWLASKVYVDLRTGFGKNYEELVMTFLKERAPAPPVGNKRKRQHSA